MMQLIARFFSFLIHSQRPGMTASIICKSWEHAAAELCRSRHGVPSKCCALQTTTRYKSIYPTIRHCSLNPLFKRALVQIALKPIIILTHANLQHREEGRSQEPIIKGFPMVHNSTTNYISLWIFLIMHSKTSWGKRITMLRWRLLFFLTGIFMKNKSNCFGMNIAEMHGKHFDRASIFSSIFSLSSLIKFTKGNKTPCWPAWQKQQEGNQINREVILSWASNF